MRKLLGILAIPSLVLAAACSDDDDGDRNGGGDDGIEEDIEEPVEEVGARAAAETVRATLKARDLGDGENLRDVAILQDAVDQLPGSPDARGLHDDNGDGQDDDGLVEIGVGDEWACVSVGEDNETVDVTGGTCQSA